MPVNEREFEKLYVHKIKRSKCMEGSSLLKKLNRTFSVDGSRPYMRSISLKFTPFDA